MEEIEFAHIASAMRPKLVAYSQSILSASCACESAEDIVQETLVKLWNIRGKLDQYQSIEALGKTIAKNICIDRIRHGKHQQSRYAVESWEEIPCEAKAQCTSTASTDASIIGKDTLRQIEQALSKLPSTQRRMLLMRSEGMELDEIAATCGANKTSTKTMISSARRAMLKMIRNK